MTTAAGQTPSYDRYPTIPLPSGQTVTVGADAWREILDAGPDPGRRPGPGDHDRHLSRRRTCPT